LYNALETSDLGYLACGIVFPMPPDTGSQDGWVLYGRKILEWVVLQADRTVEVDVSIWKGRETGFRFFGLASLCQ